jgi:hypothetical protein
MASGSSSYQISRKSTKRFKSCLGGGRRDTQTAWSSHKPIYISGKRVKKRKWKTSTDMGDSVDHGIRNLGERNLALSGEERRSF